MKIKPVNCQCHARTTAEPNDNTLGAPEHKGVINKKSGNKPKTRINVVINIELKRDIQAMDSYQGVPGILSITR